MHERPGKPTPTLVALLLCDQVIDDRLTGKKSAIGLFNMVVVPNTPSRLANMVVMASLTEISARTTVELRLMRDADNATILRTQGVVDAPDPLATVELVFAMQGVQIPSHGQFAFELWAQGEMVGRRRFQVVPNPTARRAEN
ncbi:MAG: hypothetical protein HZB38_06435 [Planctomycetes bacterium]|nr:hypothetical protein [Planctomycetota bacterium]